jgi:lysophospholipase L1-like esterase
VPRRRLPIWDAALEGARAGWGSARLLMLGDSTTFGYGARGGKGYLRNLGVPAHLAALLTASSGVGAQANGWMGLSLPEGDPRVVLGEGWTAGRTPASLGGCCIRATLEGGVLSFAPGVPVDTFSVYYIANPANGTILLDIDGEGGQREATSDGYVVSVATVRAPVGLHTLNVTASVLASGIFIVGCDAHDSGVDRISVIGAGWHGAVAAQVADAREYFSSANALRGVKPDLTTVNVGINDWHNAVPLEEFAASLQACVDAARWCGDVAMFTPTPTRSTEVPESRQRDYVERIARVCESNDIPLIDLFSRFGSWEAADARGLMNDPVHPNAAGYAEAAAAAVEVILW